MLQTSNMAVNLLTVFWEYLDMTTCYLDITVHYLDLTEGPDTRCNIVCNCVRRGGDNCCKLCKQGNLIGYMQAFCCVTPLHAMLQETVQYRCVKCCRSNIASNNCKGGHTVQFSTCMQYCLQCCIDRVSDPKGQLDNHLS